MIDLPEHWRFALDTVVGQGASGIVWRAKDKQTNAIAAVKLARDPSSAAALAHEAESLLLVGSPHLPSVLDLGQLPHSETQSPQPQAFLALSWVQGQRLCPQSIPDSQRIAIATAIARDVGAALDDLHQAGMAHGDVSPNNILIDQQATGYTATLIDLGYAVEANTDDLWGLTLRYAPPELAHGQRNAIARDLWGFGLCLAEVLDATIAQSATPATTLWSRDLIAPWGAWLRALTAQQPSARPSAAWISRWITGFRSNARRPARVRTAYLRTRKQTLALARQTIEVRISESVCPWLEQAVRIVRTAHALRHGSAPNHTTTSLDIQPLDAAGIKRWLVALVGVGATHWSLPSTITQRSERDLAALLERLAHRKDPSLWTLLDVLGVLHDDAIHDVAPKGQDPEDDVPLALALVQRPVSAAAMQVAEQRLWKGSLPEIHRVLLAKAMRSAGGLGTAYAVVDGCSDTSAEVLRADLLRRMGRNEQAIQLATSLIAKSEVTTDHKDEASAILARAMLDNGHAAQALQVIETCQGAPAAEVRALAQLALGDHPRAIQSMEEGLAVAHNDEERARLLCVQGMEAHARGASKQAYDSFVQATEYAIGAGSIIEEATYQTGVAAAAVDAGYVEKALDASLRAELLWEHLGRPEKMAFALLARASAYHLVGCTHDARQHAQRALDHARTAGDPRVIAYVRMLMADLQSGEQQQREADLAFQALSAHGIVDDRLRAQARKASMGALSDDQIRKLDLVAESENVGVTAKMEWWTARARAWNGGHRLGRDMEIVSKIVRLIYEPMPIGIKGPGVLAARILAASAADGETTRTLAALQTRLSLDLLEHVPSWLRDSALSVPWVTQVPTGMDQGATVDRVQHLEVLIRAMAERNSLRQVLDRSLDALVLWTGVERGILLLRAPGNRLVIRAARNLERRDLQGDQLELSHSLAQRALVTREPVVAVDASGEMTELHSSVGKLGLRSVLAVPLISRGEVQGVAYLDDRLRKGAFGPQELSWVRLVAGIAAMAIADARSQVLLRRAARTTARANAILKEQLAQREAELERVEKVLASGQSRPRRGYEAIIGESEPVRRMLALVDRVAATDLPVLVEGETGSGKELVAKAVHDNSHRRSKPFVTENCSAIPEALFESTLFGHLRGSFTGADRRRLGLFEVADGGTLFLDEVGEIPLPLQSKLLRVLQNGEIYSVGSSRPTRVDVRIIAATNRDLRTQAAAGSFREDLFFRLGVVTIPVPSLRERIEDVPLLVKHFLDIHGKNRKIKLTREAWKMLESHSWPGNVRELENEIRRALALSDDVIREQDLSIGVMGPQSKTTSAPSMNLKTRLEELERELVREALERTAGNQSRAAQLLGVSRYGLQKMIKRLDVIHKR
ncbi:MAG TPA: sigma 54-interacting transcriptional regulator [Polyangiaceae bacterium]|nr:MAG: Transcriptional regulatory protein ZraR [Deltaproteobacteria bacterium ADurb.Bin207]HNZ22517.1 sigma 54-interacting transcriptional regulator [Polyangiaceae bacterium]HOD22743.1 sigma 54-interacting transcriptional regulator [Polyangiaceae bacterium]HOE48523.1 sigma 54-interacting transcriptional regulator [Polyangiaceae bacterium]HOH00178.1 sigma 54-interacting transcriptional regulator [Polyangiaceae bacterium]